MNKIIRFYNQNRAMFWIIVVSIIAIIALIQTLNSYYKENKNISSDTTSITTYNAIQTPAITGGKVSESTTNNTTKIINDFINYCNNRDFEKAYEFLSNDCKEQEYPNLEKFIKNYGNMIFSEYRIYSIKAWITSKNKITYRVTFTEDILATGNSQELSIEDYYTLVKENGEYKLNIHNYVGKQEINANKTEKNISFNVMEKYVYMEYEIFKIRVKNESDKKIMLDSREGAKNINIIDQNKAKYIAFLNEINSNDLIIYPGMTKELNIKFNKSYNPEYVEKYMQFSDIVLDTENKENKAEIKVEL